MSTYRSPLPERASTPSAPMMSPRSQVLIVGQGFFRQGLAVDVDLQALAAVLEDDEGTAVEHDPTGHLDRDRCGFQLFLGLVGVLFLQVREVGVAAEVVGEGDGPGFAHGGKFFLALGDQLVFFLLQFVLVELLVAHGLGGSWLGSLACGNGLRNRGEKRSERRQARREMARTRSSRS